MKVIIVEVTRAANSFGAVHLKEIRKAYDGIAAIVEAAREEGSFKSGIPSEFAAMCFYGAIEQLLTGWIFELLPRTDEDYERAKDLVVEAICGGLENGADRSPGRVWLNQAPMDNDIVKRLMWGGLLAGVGALATIVSTRIATAIWIRVFKEDPPTD